MSMKAFTTKRAESKKNVLNRFCEASAGSKGLCAFTLIETMIAITILSLSISGPLFSANRAIVAVNISRDRLVASYLAQEGIEYVRLMRDDAFLAAYQAGSGDASSVGWASFLSGADATSITQCRATTCTLDPARAMGTGSGLSLETCSGNSCGPLYLANSIYTQQSGIIGSEETPFTRTVQAVDVSANDERIVSIVSWEYHGTTYSVTMYDHLTPWQ